MIIEWIVLGIAICYILLSLYKHFRIKTKVTPLLILLIISLFFMLPIFPISRLTLLGLFLFERLWLLLAVVLIIELMINKKNIALLTFCPVISVIIYFFLHTVI